jgi:hypothetical protein
VSFTNFDDHDSCRGNTVQTLTQWWHPVASSAALDVLHWAMRIAIALYRCIAMAIVTAWDLLGGIPRYSEECPGF